MTVALLTPDAPAMVSGIAAAICLTACPMFKSRRMILLAQLGAGLCFATHYALLGIAVASAVNVLGLVQTSAALFAARNAAMNRLGYALVVAMAVVCLWFWQGPISLLSMSAMTLIAIGRMQANELYLRGLLLAGGCFWMVHDFIGEAWIAFTADVGCFVLGAVAIFSLLFRVTVEWRPARPAPMAPAA